MGELGGDVEVQHDNRSESSTPPYLLLQSCNSDIFTVYCRNARGERAIMLYCNKGEIKKR